MRSTSTGGKRTKDRAWNAVSADSEAMFAGRREERGLVGVEGSEMRRKGGERVDVQRPTFMPRIRCDDGRAANGLPAPARRSEIPTTPAFRTRQEGRFDNSEMLGYREKRFLAN